MYISTKMVWDKYPHTKPHFGSAAKSKVEPRSSLDQAKSKALNQSYEHHVCIHKNKILLNTATSQSHSKNEEERSKSKATWVSEKERKKEKEKKRYTCNNNQ